MPTPDDHLQDPALARELRDMDLPGPAVPRWSAEQVRRRGASRRQRRHALWAGSGLVAAALVGALVMGPLTPGRGDADPLQGAAPGQVSAAAPAPASPGTAAADTGDPSPSPSQTAIQPDPGGYEVTSVTVDLDAQKLETYQGSGANDTIEVHVAPNKLASQVLAGRTVATVSQLEDKARFFGENVGIVPGYDFTLQWVATLRLDDGAEVKVTAPLFCNPKCGDGALAGYPVLMLDDVESALAFHDAVSIGLRVGIVPPGSKTGDPTQDASMPSSTSGGSRSTGKNAPLSTGSPSGSGRPPAATGTPAAKLTPSDSAAPGWAGAPDGRTAVPAEKQPAAPATPPAQASSPPPSRA